MTKKLNLLGFLGLFALISCQTKQEKTMVFDYPETKKVNHADTYHGVEVADTYKWLEDDQSEETKDWVIAQNKVTFGYLESIGFRKGLQNRIERLMDYERISAPFREGDFEYFYKNDGLQDHSVLYRTKIGDADSAPEVFLDPNGFSTDGTVALRGVFFTKDGTLSAHMITEGGSDWRKVIVMDAVNKEVKEDTLINVKFSGISWKWKEGFYYSSYDNPKDGSQLSGKTQHHKLYYHKLGTPQSEDELVFGGEKQPNRYIFGFVTDDQNYLVISAAQNTSGNRLYVKDLQKSNSDFILFQEDYYATCDYEDNVGSKFYLYTNIDAPNYRLVSVDLDNPDQSNWKDVIPESENVLRIGAGGGKFFANYLIDAKTAIKQYDRNGQLEREVQLPGIGSAYGFSAKEEDTELYYTFTSFTFPQTIYKYNIALII